MSVDNKTVTSVDRKTFELKTPDVEDGVFLVTIDDTSCIIDRIYHDQKESMSPVRVMTLTQKQAHLFAMTSILLLDNGVRPASCEFSFYCGEDLFCCSANSYPEEDDDPWWPTVDFTTHRLQKGALDGVYEINFTCFFELPPERFVEFFSFILDNTKHQK